MARKKPNETLLTVQSGEMNIVTPEPAATTKPPGHPGARDGRKPTVGSQFAHAMAFELGDVQVARRIHGDVARREQRGIEGSGPVGRRGLSAGAGNGDDDAVGT